MLNCATLNYTNQMQRILVAIDNGFNGTKVYCIINGKEYMYQFASRYEKILIDDDMNINNTDKLFYNESVYLVGEGATNSSLDDDKFNNDLHKICTYAALSKLSNFIGYEFDLVVSYPLATCSVSKDSFSDYLKSNDIIDTEFNGELKRFKINNISVVPQGASAIYSQNPSMFKNKIVGILDIGGKTINGIIMDNLNPIRRTMFTEDLGVFIYYNKLKTKLNMEGYNVMDYQIPSIVKNGIIPGVDKDIFDKINSQVISEHLNEIKTVMRKNKWAIESMEILTIGGGSLLFADDLCKIIPRQIDCDGDPVYATVKGCYQLGRVCYGY